MNNKKILSKILVVALALMTVLGAFVVNGAAEDVEYLSGMALKFTEGIDFNNLTVGDAVENTRNDVAKKAGLCFVNMNAGASSVSVVDVNGDKKIGINKPVYLRGDFHENRALGELLFSENGPKRFKIEFELTINNAIVGTATANNTANYATTGYRGFSLFNVGTNWMVKATAPGVGTLNIKKDDANGNDVKVKADGTGTGDYYYVESVNPGTENVGYIYANNTSYYFPASAKMGWAGTGYNKSTAGAVVEGGKTYVAGTTDAAITNDVINGVANGFAYTVGKPMKITLTFTRTEFAGANNDSVNVALDIDGKRVKDTHSYTTNLANLKAGIRITDIEGTNTTLDNFKVILDDENPCTNGAHGSFYGWNAGVKPQVAKAADGSTVFKKVCTFCNQVVNDDFYTNLVADWGNIENLANKAQIISVRDLRDTLKKSPFWLSYDWTVDALPTSGDQSVLTWLSSLDGSNINYLMFMRVFSDGSVKKSSNSGGYEEYETPVKVSVGKTYKVDLRIDMNACSYQLFIDGVYVGSGASMTLAHDRAETGTYPYIRFCNDKAGTYDFMNIKLTTSVTADAHNHTRVGAIVGGGGVIVGDKSITTADSCYCGEPVSGGEIIELCADNLVDSYEGSAVVNGAPTTGEYWIAFDYNVRTATAVSGAGVTAVKVGDCILLDSRAAVTEPTTVSYAINVKYTDERKLEYTVYENGIKINNATVNSAEGDLSVITFGDSRVNDVRFNYIKVARVGEGTAVEPTFTANNLRPCFHSNYPTVNGKLFMESGKLYRSGICSGCGETYSVVFNSLLVSKSGGAYVNDEFLAGRTVKVDNAVKYVLSSADIITTKAKGSYIVEFDVNVENIDSSNMHNGGNGRTLFGTWSEKKGSGQHMLRIHDIPGEPNKAEIRIGSSETAPLVNVIEKGHNYHFKLMVDPINRKIEIESRDIDSGEPANKTSGTLGNIDSDSGNYYFRFVDSTIGIYNISNFALYNLDPVADAESHVHTDAWINADEVASSKLVLVDGNKVAYEVACYCGATITRGIDAPVVDAISPVYGNEGAVIAATDVAAPAKDFAILARINAKTLAGADDALVSIGEQTLVAIAADGTLTVGGDNTSAVFTAGREYHDVAVYFDTDKSVYYVYFDGVNVGAAEYDELSGDLVLFGDNGNVYNLERVAFVALETGANNTYTVGASTHVHALGNAVADGLALNGFGQNATISYTCPVCYATVTETIADSVHRAEVAKDAIDFHYVTFVSGDGIDDFWIFVEANNRNADELAITGNIVKVGNAVLAAYDNGKIVGYNGVESDVTLEDVGTHKIAVRASAEGYMLYVDGKLVTVADVAGLADITGDVIDVEIGGVGCQDVRFFNPAFVTFDQNGDYIIEWEANDLRPCYHDAYGKKNTAIVCISGDYYYSYTCEACGETIQAKLADKFDPSKQDEEDVKDRNFALKAMRIQLDKSVIVNTATLPYYISFDLKCTSFKVAEMLNFSQNDVRTDGRNFFGFIPGWTNILRMFLVPIDGLTEDDYEDSDKGPVVKKDAKYFRNDVVTLRVGADRNSTKLIDLYTNETYKIVLRFDPATGNKSYYINGKCVYTAKDYNISNSTNESDCDVRFFESTWAEGEVTNFTFAQVIPAEPHVHSDKWVTHGETGINLTKKTAEPYYYCYCGEKVYYGDVTRIGENICNVYDGHYETTLASAEAGTWFVTDFNIRDISVADGNILKIGDTTVLKLENGGICYGDGSMMMPFPESSTTLSLAIKYVENSLGADFIDLYVDGKIIASNYAVEGNLAMVTLGDEAFGEDVRFNYNRAFRVAEAGEEIVIPGYIVNDEYRPCYHKSNGSDYATKIYIDENGELNTIFICDNCGERAYETLTDSVLDPDAYTSSDYVKSSEVKAFVTNNNPKYVRLEKGVAGNASTQPYWIAFDFTPESLPTATGKDVNKDGKLIAKADQRSYKGWNLVTVQQTNDVYVSELRIIADGWEEGNATDNDNDTTKRMTIGEKDGKWQVHIVDDTTNAGNPKFRFSKPVAYLEIGKTTSFALLIYPATGAYDVYVDGQYVASSVKADGKGYTEATAVGFPRIRFGDGETPGKWNVENLTVANNLITHTHSDAWLTNAELEATTATRSDDYKLTYSYQCYCGKIVEYGISEIYNAAIAPKYGITDATAIVENLVIPENDFWFVGDISAMALPTEGTKALASIGDQMLVGINELGELTTGGKLAVDNKYHTLAIYFNVADSTYTVYLDGKYTSIDNYDELAGDLVIASEGAGKYHFDSAAVVALAENSSMSYPVAEGAHTHWYAEGEATLSFNDNRTAIVANYVCAECNRPVFDGLSKNLFDNEATPEVETIIPVFGVETAIIEDSAIIATNANYWFSFDAVLKSEGKGNGSLIKLVDSKDGEIALLTVNTNGTVKNANGKTVAILGTTLINISINVVNNSESSVYYVYADGIYCGKFDIALDAELTYDVVLGSDDATGIELTDIKFAEMLNGENLEIGTFVCSNTDHVPAINKNATLEYFNVNELKFTTRCERCGAVITEEIIASLYEATPYIYESFSGMDVELNTEVELTTNYWIAVDVNVRGNIGTFGGYVPLISIADTAFLLINQNGELMLGDGTKIGYALTATSTYNIALRLDLVAEKAALFIDGKYVATTTGEIAKKGYAEGTALETFGAPELKNIRYYNIKSVVTGVTETPLSVNFIEDASVIPCVHDYHNFQNVTILFEEQIKEVYICNKCGERVVRVNNKDVLDHDGNKFIVDGAFKITTYQVLESSGNVISRDGAPYWIRFTVKFEDIASAETLNNHNGGAGRKGGVTLFGLSSSGSYPTILRMFSVEDGKGGYIDDVVEIRDANSRNATLIATVYEGETHEFVIGVNPSNGLFRVYMDGVLKTQRTAGTFGTNRAEYNFRFLDGKWGTYSFSNFEFVSAGKHEHTPLYADYITGGYDVLAFTDATLTHNYTCYCGAVVSEGISQVYKDLIPNVSSATSFVAIANGAAIKMRNEPYWFSVKVFNTGASANVYSYGQNEPMVEIAKASDADELVFWVDGVETALAPSAAGDYDVVSVRVDPVTGDYLVYVNGAYLASGNASFKINENFNILLGGNGSDVSFTHMKLVELADGVHGRVSDCGDHSFNNAGMVITYVTKDVTIGEGENAKTAKQITKLTYKCSFCQTEIIRTVTPGADDNQLVQTGVKTNGSRTVLRSEPKFEAGSDVPTYDFDRFEEFVDKKYTGSRWLTFDATVTDISIGAGVNKAFVCWVYDYNHGVTEKDSNGKTLDGTCYSRFFRAYGVDDDKNKVEVRLFRDGGHVKANGEAIISEGNTYKFAVEYFTSTGVYHAYMSEAGGDVLYYLGEGKLNNMDYSETGSTNTNKPDAANAKHEEYGIRWGDGGVGTIEINNINVFNGTYEDRTPEDTSIKLPKHFPKDGKPGTITNVDGKLTHTFLCSCCNATITYETFHSIQNPALNGNKTITELLDVKGNAHINVDQSKVVGSKGATPYYLAFDLTVDKINVASIMSSGENGASILALVCNNAGGKSANYLNFLRAYYRDGKIVLDSPLDSGNKFELVINEGETYSFVFAINPKTGKIICSLNGETTIMLGDTGSVGANRENYYFRFTDTYYGVLGQYDFTNIKIGYMTDECAHPLVTCADVDTKSYVCSECGEETFTAHYYTVVSDATGKWTAYVCTECGEYFMVFNDYTLVKDMTFANSEVLMNYLAKTYPPVFVILPE